MCGILGIINPQAHLYITEGSSRMVHRGTDDDGIFNFKNFSMAHRRLSIIDLSDNAHQPMFSADRRYTLIFNGEIYNHQQLRESLKTKHSFISSSDTETLLCGLIEYGEAFLNQINGIFSFALYDSKTQDILIARDQLGVKPLYYYCDNQTFAFGSEIKSFLKLPNFDKTINPESLVNYVTLLWSGDDTTPFKKVKKLPVGHYLKVNVQNHHAFQINQYYQIPFTGQYSSKSEIELIDELEQRLLKAVERQMVADVDVAFFLSGGLDSSAVVAIARKLYPLKSFKCYTIKTNRTQQQTEGFEDDLHYARLVANHLSVSLTEVEEEQNILQEFDRMVYHLEEPQADFAPINVLKICELAKSEGYKVLLGGVAGDELFSGYRRHQALVYERYLKILPNYFLKIIKLIIDKLSIDNPFKRRFKKIFAGLLSEPSQRMYQYYEWISLEKVKTLFRDKSSVTNFTPKQYFDVLLREIPNEKSSLNQLLFWDLKTFLPNHNLNYTDKMGMAVGVEIRVPFLDIELVEFSCIIPPEMKMKGINTKYLLKKLMEKYLPLEVINRSKTGFGVPVRQWMKDNLDIITQLYLSKEQINKRGIFDASEVQKLITDNKNGIVDASYSILCLMAIESWCRQFLDDEISQT